MKGFLSSCVKSTIIGICFGIGVISTAAIAVTVSATYTDGDTLSAAALNSMKSAVESIPGWAKGTTPTDAVYTDGNVGIGITSPTFYSGFNGLHINDPTGSAEVHLTGQNSGSTSTDGAHIALDANKDLNLINLEEGNIKFYTNDLIERMRIDKYGKVLIRNSDSNSHAGISMFDDRNSASYVSQWGLYGTTASFANDMFFYNTAGGGIGFFIGSGTASSDIKLKIQSSGNVGIGTTTPSVKLHVVDNVTNVPATFESTTEYSMIKFKDDTSTANIGIKGEEIFFDNHADGREMTILADGNIGIGTATPKTKLDVEGGIQVGNEAATCDADQEGTIKYVTGVPGNFFGCRKVTATPTYAWAQLDP